MKKAWELLELFKSKSFLELIIEKKNNFKIRASNNENLINTFNSNLDSIYNIVKYFDEKCIELKNLLEKNSNLEINEADFSKINATISNYSSIIQNLENFKEWEPEINWIVSSQQFRQFQEYINNLNQNNNWIQIEKYNNQIDNILNNLRINILYYEKDKLKTELLEAKKIADEIITKKSDFDNASSIIESIIENKEKNIKSEIKEHFEYFEKEGKNNKWFLLKDNKINIFNYKNYISFKIIWLFLSLLTWILTVLYIFSIFSKTGLSIWDSVLTISFYFIVYFSKQYSNHKDLDKSYTFKAISLKVMLWLSEISNENEKNMIYEKALDKIFSEPNVRISNKDWDIINVIKDTIPTKIQTNLKDN